MSFFTVLIIIGAIYQLVTAVTKKKGIQQTPRKLSDSSRPPKVPSLRDVIQGTSSGTWREQLKQALKNGRYQAGTLEPTKPGALEENEDYYNETDEIHETQGVEIIQGTSEHVGILGSEAYKNAKEIPGQKMDRKPSNLKAVHHTLTQRELVQGVIWAEILGKPRAMHSFRGPRT